MRAPLVRVVGAIMRRDFQITRSYRAPFVLDIFFGIMNLVVFYYISQAVSIERGDLGGATTYFAFASVGTMLTVVVQSATAGLAARIREEQLTGTLEMLVMQPVSSVHLPFGLTGFPFLFGSVRVALYVAFAGAFLDLGLGNASWPGFFAILIAATLALSGVGIILGAVVLVLKQGTTLAIVLMFGFGLLSGAVFPRDLLPGWLETLGHLLPTRFALDGLRSALFTGAGWEGDFVALMATAAVLLPLSVWFFVVLLQVVKRSGSLSQY